MKKETLYAKLALVVGIVFMLGLPWILTRNWGFISFSNTGSIGDTIGGITAPISGILGAYLVFLALKAQVAANKQIQLQIEEQNRKNRISNQIIITEKLLTRLESKIENFKITQPNTYKFNPQIKGHQGVRAILINFLSYSNGKQVIEMQNGFLEINDLLDFFDYVLENIENLPIVNRRYYLFSFEDIYGNAFYDTGVPQLQFGESDCSNESVKKFVDRFIQIQRKIEKIRTFKP